MKSLAKLPRRRQILVGLVLLVLALAWLFIKWIGGPAEGKISPGSNALTLGSKTASPDQGPEYIRLDGEYISFAYPKTYRLDKGDTSAAILESYHLITTTKGIGFSRTIAITVFDLPSAKLEDNSAYKIRKDNPGLYKETVTRVNGNQVIFFKKTDEQSVVAFLPRGNKLATIGFSGSIQTPEAQKEYDYVLNSWQWL